MKTNFEQAKLLAKYKKQLQKSEVSIIVDTFKGVDWHKVCNVFPVFTVYFNTADFPGKWACRVFDGMQPLRIITLSETLEEAREKIPEIFYRTNRKENDAPHIVEAWI